MAIGLFAAIVFSTLDLKDNHELRLVSVRHSERAPVDPLAFRHSFPYALPRGRSLEGPMMASFEKERDRLDAQILDLMASLQVADCPARSRSHVQERLKAVLANQ